MPGDLLLVQTQILNLSTCVGLNPAKVSSFLCQHFSLCEQQWISTFNGDLACQMCFFQMENSFIYVPALMLFPFLVKTANKKAEKTKKGALKTPNSISEGEGQHHSIQEGEWTTGDTHTCYGEFMISYKLILPQTRLDNFSDFTGAVRMGKKKKTLRDDNYFGKGREHALFFQRAYFPREERSGNISWCSLKWS